MDNELSSGMFVTPLKRIPLNTGDVLHGMKRDDSGFVGFGEAYFSFVNHGVIKAWKMHTKVTLNLVVPIGKIKFVTYDDRASSLTYKKYCSITLSKENYQRLTIPPMLWMGFQGLDEHSNLLLDITDLPHDPTEEERCDIDSIPYSW